MTNSALCFKRTKHKLNLEYSFVLSDFIYFMTAIQTNGYYN